MLFCGGLWEDVRREAVGPQAVLAAPDYDPDQLQIIKVKDLAQAVEAARKAAQPGDIVSLCPACPAFDQFKTFEYRGREFKRLVNAF